jgi:L-iditol 2-dehydrogenase
MEIPYLYHMKAMVLEEYMNLVVKDVPEPEIKSGEVLVQVKAAGICGSDVHGMDGSSGRRLPPLIMGHEASGIIMKTGDAVTGWKKGDRVTFDSTIYKLDDWYTRRGMYNLSDERMVLGVSTPDFKRNGAYAEYVAVPQHILYRIPKEVSFTQAAMVEPAAVALHAINLLPVKVNDTAVIVGSGMIGLFVIQLLRIAGCANIAAVDLDTGRLKLAGKFGATHAFHPEKEDVIAGVRNLTGGRGADIALEVVGISASVRTAINCLRKGGSLGLVGNISTTVEIPLQDVVTRQIRLQGSCAINGEFDAILDLMARGMLSTDAILSAEAPLSEGPKWFERLYNKEKGLMKVVLIP